MRAPASPRPQTTPFLPHPVTPSSENLSGTANLLWALRILVAAAAGMAVLLSLLPAAGHDQLWFLLMAQRWLGGSVLYGPSLFDSNPPLIVWLSTIPVLLGQHLLLPAPAAGKFLILLAELFSAWLSLQLLQSLRRFSRTELTWLAFASILIFAVAPARDFGQRDHLTAILSLPYVLGAAADDLLTPKSRRRLLLHCLAGALISVGICLKPHQALIPLAVELIRIFRDFPPGRLRSLLRPEPPILVLAGCTFLLLIRRLTPAYFTLAVPLLHDTYWAIGHLTPIQLLAEAPQLHLLGALALGLFAFARGRARQSPLRPAVTSLLVAACAATAAYYLQGTGWYYQQLPAISFFAAALALELLDLPLLRRLSAPPWLPRWAAALALVTLALTTHFTGYPFTLARSFSITSPDPAFFERLAPGTPVAMITTSVDDTMMPVARYHLFWAQRTNNVWPLPAILRSEDPQGRPPKHSIPQNRLATLDRQQHAWMVEDLNRWQPQLILVARCQDPGVQCQEIEDRHDNLLAWYSRDPAFQALWSRYRYLRTSGPYDAYVIQASPLP